MATVVFVHGTGVREPDISTRFRIVKDALLERDPALGVVNSPWGEEEGFFLHKDGATIPEYAGSRRGGVLGGPEAPGDEETESAYLPALWGLLYGDALAQLRALSLEADDATAESAWGGFRSEDDLDSRVRGLSTASASPPLLTGLAQAGVTETFDDAVRNVTGDQTYREVLDTVPREALDDYRLAVARAITAEAMAETARRGTPARAFTDASSRDALVEVLAGELGAAAPGTLAIWDPLVSKSTRIMAQVLTAQARRRRAFLTDRALGFIGDVLLYQGSGSEIRDRIRAEVERAQPPVVLLAHSLGGIACVDLLVERDLSDRVRLLITVGSQAPVLYEMGALYSMEYEEPNTLPAHFPPWVNIYDQQDFLSYIGEPVFPGRITDLRVDGRQPFPEAHSAYWTNPAVYDEILRAIADPPAVIRRGGEPSR